LIINCINPRFVRRYFGMLLEEIDGKFSTAYDAPEFHALLKSCFRTEPTIYLQQPLPASSSFADTLRVWLTPLTWPFRRHPVVPGLPGADGMYLCAVVTKSE